MNFSELGQWQNLIFAVPFAIGLALVLISVSGVGDDGDGGDAADAAGVGDFEGGGDGNDGDGDDGDSDDGWHGLKAALRIENISTSMLLQNFFLFWGICGFTCNQLLKENGRAGLVGISIAFALIAGCILTVLLSSVLSRFTPRDETEVVNQRALLGRIGEAMSPITSSSGSVYVRDASGTLHHLSGRNIAEDEVIAKGDAVLIIDHDDAAGRYLVKQWTDPGSALDAPSPEIPLDKYRERVPRAAPTNNRNDNVNIS